MIAKAICKVILRHGGAEEVPPSIQFNRAYRMLGSPKSNVPRDIVIRVHDFTIKEWIAAKMWAINHFDLQGYQIAIFANLAKGTLQRRKKISAITQTAARTVEIQMAISVWVHHYERWPHMVCLHGGGDVEGHWRSRTASGGHGRILIEKGR